MRMYDGGRGDLHPMPNGLRNFNIGNTNQFTGVCPKTQPDGSPTVVREFNLTAVLVNDVFDNPVEAVIPAGSLDEEMTAAWLNGARLDANGGTLVYNPRGPGHPAQFNGPLHDPTAIVYVKTTDLEAKNPNDPNCWDGDQFKPSMPSCPVRAKPGVTPQPLTIRAAAGDCIEITVRNRLPGGELTDENGNTVLEPPMTSPGRAAASGRTRIRQLPRAERVCSGSITATSTSSKPATRSTWWRPRSNSGRRA
jgi:hypothetical protein